MDDCRIPERRQYILRLPVYFDNHATTPVDEEVLNIMLVSMREVIGNPASDSHLYGVEAKTAVETARNLISYHISARPSEIVFTSGATEAINTAIKGLVTPSKLSKCHFVTTQIEHKAVLDCHTFLQQNGAEVTFLPTGSNGIVCVDKLSESIKPNTVLVSVIAANNEIGTIQPIAEIGKICRDHGTRFLTDATQAFGKIPLNVEQMQIDMMAASAHKIHGPKGIGFLYIRSKPNRIHLSTLIHGGGQERGLRSGTLNVAGIAGFSKATDIAIKRMSEDWEFIKNLRDQLRDNLLSRLDFTVVNGDVDQRLPNNLSIAFLGVDSEALMLSLRKDVAISSGSACTASELLPSHVLRGIGLADEWVSSTIRIGLSRFNTLDEVDYVSDRIVYEVARLRGISPFYETLTKKYVDRIRNGVLVSRQD